MKKLTLVFALALVLTACESGTAQPPDSARPESTSTTTQVMQATSTSLPPTSPSDAIKTSEDWHRVVTEIATAPPVQAQAEADALWQSLVDAGRVPLVLGDQVVFLYKGRALTVAWRGVFTRWKELPPLDGCRVGTTDLWIAQTSFPATSRVEYRIVLNTNTWISDPGNPATVPSGDTDNNLLVMPGFQATDSSAPRAQVIPGTLSDNIPIASRNMGYTINYRVYTPVGYDKLSKLPVLYVLDGSDFIDPRMGSLPNVLDNLLADGRIRPLIAVSIDPYEPGNPKHNRREQEFLGHPEEYARFVATEIVPTIDATYRTDPSPGARTIFGVSYGGLSSTFIAASYPQVFHNLAAFSPSYWVLSSPQSLVNQDLIDGARKMPTTITAALNCGGKTGIQCPPLQLKIFLTFGVPDWDVGDLNTTVAQLQSKGYPLRFIQTKEGHAWSAWRGLLDEMLINFLGK